MNKIVSMFFIFLFTLPTMARGPHTGYRVRFPEEPWILRHFDVISNIMMTILISGLVILVIGTVMVLYHEARMAIKKVAKKQG